MRFGIDGEKVRLLDLEALPASKGFHELRIVLGILFPIGSVGEIHVGVVTVVRANNKLHCSRQVSESE